MTDKNSFYLDRRLSVGVIVTLTLQTASALMWAGAAEARINTLESRLSQAPHMSERLARLEEKVDLTRETVVRIEQRLDAVTKP